MEPVVFKYYKVESLGKLKKQTRGEIEEIMSMHRNHAFKLEAFKKETPGAYILVMTGKKGNVIGLLRIFKVTKAIRSRVNYNGKSPTAYINALVVRAAYRGKGYGTELLNTAKILAKELGFKKIVLEVVSTNDAAMRLYLKTGFKLIASYYWGNESAHLMEAKIE
jgi:ribosomal protein S18 acetylase RimI-like enzyme